MSSTVHGNESTDRDDFDHDARGPLLRDFGDSDESGDEGLVNGWRVGGDEARMRKKSTNDFYRYLSFACAMLSW
jgi:hypothetical protein